MTSKDVAAKTGLSVTGICRLDADLRPTRLPGNRRNYDPDIVDRFIAAGKAVIKTSCGDCGSNKHTAKRCPLAKRRAAARLPDIRIGTLNEHYRPNRKVGACDNCGRRTKRAYCKRCSTRRRLRPSRQPVYRRARGDGYGGRK